MQDAELALGRSLTLAERLWFRYSAPIPDFLLYCHNILFLFLIFSVAPLPLAFIELKNSKSVAKYKLQPKVRLPLDAVVKCYMDVMRMFVFVVGPLQLCSYPIVMVINSPNLPLPRVSALSSSSSATR